MARKVFISILGASFYGYCKYTKGEFVSSETRFVQQATLELLNVKKDWGDKDMALFLLTERARKDNWTEELSVRKDNRTGNDVPYLGLQKELKDMGLPFKPKDLNIPDGKDEPEMWEIFNILFNELQKDDELYFDLTHSFRYLPMLVLVLGNYAKFLKKVTVKYISYGNYEARDTVSNEAPIVDLLPLSSLQDWTFAAANFIENGNAERIEKLSNDKVSSILRATSGKDEKAGLIKGFGKALLQVTNDMNICRGINICKGDNMQKLKSYLKDVDANIIKPLSPIVTKIEESFSCFDGYSNAECAIVAARWCFEHGMYEQAVTILQEGIVTFFCLRHKLNEIDAEERKKVNDAFYYYTKGGIPTGYESREVVENIWNDETFAEELANAFFHLTDIRNDFNHSGMRKQPLTSQKIVDGIKKRINSTESLLLNRESELQNTFTPLLLINLSNHPFSAWSEQQYQAAEVYGKCVDLPFPDINPLCNDQEIEQLSDEYLEKVLVMSNGHEGTLTVHLMGELTFCFSLLRKLQSRNIRCIASCTERNVTMTEDGVKHTFFHFVRFRDYTNT
ncbi:TIGR02221 family CRISPR-associated protein [Bacteroides sp. UBA939]|uniref:TIGR02221 family CRISPR-associated protein n=1 Tax=Bacteroides sp. UBA939 TaxID=1946092 RepID=UPI0025C19BC3|nr:TIGR02221 family CRISPR-associated protein [Bacteroides sp. UBA939]